MLLHLPVTKEFSLGDFCSFNSERGRHTAGWEVKKDTAKQITVYSDTAMYYAPRQFHIGGTQDHFPIPQAPFLTVREGG